MADGGPRRGASQGSAAGVAEEIQHLYRAACRTDLLSVPCPVDGLFREKASMLEAGGADDKG